MNTLVKNSIDFISPIFDSTVELLVSLSILINEMENEDVQKILIEDYGLTDIELTYKKKNFFAIVYFILLTNISYKLPKVNFIKFSPIWVMKNYELLKYEGYTSIKGIITQDMCDYQIKSFKNNDLLVDNNKIVLRKKRTNNCNFKIVQKELLRKYYPGMYKNDSSLLPFKVKAWETFGKTFIEHDFSLIADFYNDNITQLIHRDLFNSNNFLNIYSESLFNNIELYENKIPDYIELFLVNFSKYFEDIDDYSYKLNTYVTKKDNKYRVYDKLFNYKKIINNNIEEYKIAYNKFGDDGEHNFFYLFLNDYLLDNFEDGSNLVSAFLDNKKYKNITPLKMKNYLRKINVNLTNSSVRKQFNNNYTYTNVVNILNQNGEYEKSELVKEHYGIDIFQKILEIIVGYKYFTCFTNSLIYDLFETQSINYSNNLTINYFPNSNYFTVTNENKGIDYRQITNLLYGEKIIFDKKTKYFEIN